jgi:DNA polymerase-1
MKNLLLDSYNLIHRSRFDWGGGLATGKNQIIYNFLKSIKPILDRFEPDKVFFVLDGSPKERLAIDPSYKGTRYSSDLSEEEKQYWESFHIQKRFIINFVKNHLPFTTVYHPDIECDDIINYYATKLEGDTIIVSSDTDFIQTLDKNPNVKLWNPVSGAFRERIDVDYTYYKSLVGDKSDNIPGVKGVGKVGALKMLKDLSIFNKKMENDDFKKQFDHSFSLVKFADINESLKDFQYYNGCFDKNEVLSIFESLDFKSMITESYIESYTRTMSRISI